ncbi:MAG: hypothetical protein OXG33_01970 [Chloroflexi bacterium]|nr:hypothetical protein [Chloroflexota bacterium]
MTTASGSTRTHESVINENLARLLRERLGMSTAAEVMHGRVRPDIVVRRPEGPVVLEIELEPAATVDADALSRLGLEIDGQTVQIAFAVTVPARLRAIDQKHLFERMASATFTWREWRLDGTSGPQLSGGVTDHGNAAARAAPPAGNLEQAVDALDKGVRRAGSRLYSSPGTLARVATIFNAPPSDEAAHMAALVVTNAMVFQERLASADAAIQPTNASRHNGIFSRLRLLGVWDAILDIDYYPIFKLARDVVAELSDVEAASVLDECARTAARLLSMETVGRHDLAGRIFNRLVTDRKLLAAFYTSIPAANLLAGLALEPNCWRQVNWSDPANLRQLRVVDPSCGTGTLLMAAYQQIVQDHSASNDDLSGALDDPALHQALVEQTLFGADVVQAAIHLTAATLAAMSPSVGFTQMQLYSLRMGMRQGAFVFDATEQLFAAAGVEPDSAPFVGRIAIRLGSLDWLKGPALQSSYQEAHEQIGATGSAIREVPIPQADLVISNPPYTRRGSDGGKGEALARVMALPEDDDEARKAVAKRTSELLNGTPANLTAGHGASFTVLADRLVVPGGRVALVLPVTALAGESWRDVRQMLASRYEIEFVVSSHDPELRSMSYDTEIAEALLIARRLGEDESPSRRGCFVNLWRAAYREADALALVTAINATAAAPLHRSDGPPIGGIPLFVGGEQWGELLDGPVAAGAWKPARWRQGQTGQFAAALERGELWTDDGSRVVAQLPIASMQDVCKVGPQHRRIRGSLGVFDGYHGWDEQAQFPALWAHSQKVHQGLVAEPNARLYPQAGRDHGPIWSGAGMLQITPTIRYNSQRIMATRTIVRALGVNTWFSLQVHEDNPAQRTRQEIVLALWCNSTFGMLLQANHANSVQYGRGIGNKGMLETLATLDVRGLQPWQLDEAQAIWRDFRGRTFESFHQCAVDPARIDLDQRLITDLLGLDDEALAIIARLRTLLASDPSIHGAKKPELPT